MKFAEISNTFPPEIPMLYDTKEKLNKASPEERQALIKILKEKGMPYCISGNYNWCEIFKGTYLPLSDISKDILEQFDVLHMNVHKGNIHGLKQIRECLGYNSKTKLVVNLDYSLDLICLDSTIAHSPSLIKDLDLADGIFAVEPMQRQFLEFILNRPVALMIHPIPVEYIREWVTGGKKYLPSKQRQLHNGKPIVYCTLHRWSSQTKEQDFFVPYFAFKPSFDYSGKKLPPLECNPVLTGVMPEHVSAAQAMWGKVYKHGIFPINFHQMLALGSAVYNYYPMRSMDRISLECAAVGTPCVSSNLSATGNILFPELTVEHQDVKGVYELLKRLLEDKAFWSKCTWFASVQVEQFGYAASKQRWLDFMDNI